MVHIDVDPRTINLNYKPEVGVVGDAKLTLEAIAAADLDSGDAQFRESLLTASVESKAAMRDRLGPDHSKLLDIFSKHMDRDAYFVRDNTIPGYHWGNGLLPIFKPSGYIFPTSGAIGPGLPLGIGVAVATDTKTIVMHGDGGFMFHVGELSTAAQYKVPVVIVVFNDGGFGVLRGLQVNQFNGRFSETDLNTPDFVKLAESMGLTGLHADTPESFDEQLSKAMEIEGPVLIELNVRDMVPIQGVIAPPKN
jgi:acetolactate synthase-1/2/3 large subunit